MIDGGLSSLIFRAHDSAPRGLISHKISKVVKTNFEALTHDMPPDRVEPERSRWSRPVDRPMIMEEGEFHWHFKADTSFACHVRAFCT
jgi:hypothetical protein